MGKMKYDTPTDGVSRKAFDRYRDKIEIRYGRYTQRVLELESRVLKLEKFILDAITAEEEN